VNISFNQQKETSLTLSKSLIVEHSLLLKIKLFLSFQMIQVQAHQIRNIIEVFAFAVPTKLPNWIKWSNNKTGWAKLKPNQWRTRYHNEPNNGQSKKRRVADYLWPHPPTQSLASWETTPRLHKFSFVSNRFLSSRQMNTDTFKGTCCQMESSTSTAWWELSLARRRHTPCILYPPSRSRDQIQRLT